jgi:hypothetical protein
MSLRVVKVMFRLISVVEALPAARKSVPTPMAHVETRWRAIPASPDSGRLLRETLRVL